MYPTEEDIRRNAEEIEEMMACNIAMSICSGKRDYSQFLTIFKNDPEYIKKVENMIRHYLSLPQYKHLPVPPGFKM